MTILSLLAPAPAPLLHRQACAWPLLAALWLALPLLSGCGDNTPPELDPVGDRQAVANVELAFALHASDADGDALEFSFDGELPSIRSRASLNPLGDDRALFHWTPLASDVGTPTFDFQVSDGQDSDRETIAIAVTLSGEGSTAPIFVQPLGTGTTLDLTAQSCVQVPVAVQDADSASVLIAQAEPVIEGAELNQDGPLSAGWSFCPSQPQIDADDRYTLLLSADDGDNVPTLKDYLVVLRSGTKTDCPGQPPAVVHSPEDQSTVNDLTIVATVTDDQGIKYEPLFYYSNDSPGDPPDLSQMTQLTMVLLSGDMQNGEWGADVPNPVAGASPGSTAQLYYLIVAQDNDDAEGSCDHLTQAPANSSYSITVTNPGGSGGKGLCESCSADAQCGGPDDHCVQMGGGYHCFIACQDNSVCSSGYYCSYSELPSIDGAAGRQCIPNDYQCSGGTSGCNDDSFEDNDSLAQASGSSALSTGDHNSLVSCPAGSGDDEDWYKLDVSSDAQVTLTLSGGSATDLDLALYDANNTLIDKSDSLTSNESLATCLAPGLYYARVYAYGSAENSYGLSYTQSPQSCAPTCSDDSNEDDDNSSQAQLADLNQGAYTSTTDAICAWDDDWYEVYMYNGETIHASLTFTESNSSEDLDLYVYQGTTNLTGCDEQNPSSCDPNNGQSGTSNEQLSWPISQTDTYYVVVHGWYGSENLYDICIGLSANDCP